MGVARVVVRAGTDSQTHDARFLSLQTDGRVLLELKAPWADGTTHVAYELVDCWPSAPLLPHQGLAVSQRRGAVGPLRGRARTLKSLESIGTRIVL